MNINDFKKEYDGLKVKNNLSGRKALEAVKKNGYALQYVKDQTEAICLEAVKQNGHALQFVNEDIFTEKAKELTIKEIEDLLGYSVKIVK